MIMGRKACSQCRESKRKCVRTGPSESCVLCHERGLMCDGHLRHYQQSYRRLLALRDPADDQLGLRYRPDSLTDQEDLVLPTGMAVELVEHYLDKIHDRPHSLFHPSSLRAQVRDNVINQALLYAICALGAKFSANPDARRRQGRLVAESKRLLQADLEHVCVPNIQASILIATLCVGDGNNSSRMLFFRIAMTMSDVMRLNSPAPVKFEVEREIRRRIWWSLYMTDLWCISNLGLPSYMKGLPIMIDRPMDEILFNSLTPDNTILDTPPKPGLWAHMTTLVELYGPIQGLHRRIVNGEVPATKLHQDFLSLAQKLDDWIYTLPDNAQMSTDNLLNRQAMRLGGLLIALHLAYHHYSTLLYFGFLENQQAPSLIDRTYIKRCKWHASQFSALVQKSRQLKGCEAVYPLVAHMTTVSSSVLIYTLLFGEESELNAAREELNANFESLLELKQYWPATAAWIDRLILFQNKCLSSTETSTYRLDHWMLRLLIDYSLPLDIDRGQDGLSNTRSAPESIGSIGRQFLEARRYTDIYKELDL